MHSRKLPENFAEGSGAGALADAGDLLDPSHPPFRQGEVGWVADPANQPQQVSPQVVQGVNMGSAAVMRLEQLLQLVHKSLRKVQEERDQLMEEQQQWHAQQSQGAVDMAAQAQQLQDALDRAEREQRARAAAERQVQQLQHALASLHGQLLAEQQGQLDQQPKSLPKELPLKVDSGLVCALPCSSPWEVQQQQWGSEAVDSLRHQQQVLEHAGATAAAPLGNAAAAHGPWDLQQRGVGVAGASVGPPGLLPEQMQQGLLPAAAVPATLPPDMAAAALPATRSKRQRTEAPASGAVGEAHAAGHVPSPAWWHFDVDADLGLLLSGIE